MYTETTLVSPELAKKLLDGNINNRTLRHSYVDHLIKELSEGRWVHTHQGIAIATDGRLLDGQHRLSAIAESGLSALLNITYDCDPETFRVIDTGTARTCADVLRADSSNTRSETVTAAAVKLVYLYENFKDYIWIGSIVKISHSVLLDCYNENPDLYLYAVDLANLARREFKFFSTKSATAAFVVLALKSIGIDNSDAKAKIGDFVKKAASGLYFDEYDPCHVLRKQLINGWQPNATSKSQMWLAVWIKLYNLHINDASIKLFKSPVIPSMPPILV